MGQAHKRQAPRDSAARSRVNLRARIGRSTHILGFLVRTAIRSPRFAIAAALFLLVTLASLMTYAGFLVVGVVGEYLGTGRVLAGLLLGVLFARLPMISKGKLRTVGLLPKPLRRPVMLGLLAGTLVHLVSRGETVPAVFIVLATVVLLGLPWMRRTVFDRMITVFRTFTGGKRRAASNDDSVIDVEFREKKD